MIFIFEVCFSRPWYRIRRNPSCRFYCGFLRPRLPAPVYPLSPKSSSSLPRSSSEVMFALWMFAAAVLTVCTKPVSLSTPICALYPRNHWLSFFVECASGSRFFSAFFVEDGTKIIVESTIVPFFKNQTFCFQRFNHLRKQLFLKSVFERQITKPSECIPVGNLITWLNSAKVRKRTTVHDLSSSRFVGEIIQIPNEIDPMHKLQFIVLVSALSFVIARLDESYPLAQRNYPLYLFQKFFFLCPYL